MACRVRLQAQVAAIMDVLCKSAAAEISQLLIQQEDEIQTLRHRLSITETQLQRAQTHLMTSDKCSVGVQVESRTVDLSQKDDVKDDVVLIEEIKGKEILRFPQGHDEPTTFSRYLSDSHGRQENENEDLNGLEFEMKIEKVEEPVDQKHNQTQPSLSTSDHGCEYRMDERDAQLWSSIAKGVNVEEFVESDYCHGFQQRRQDFLAQAEQFAAAHVLIDEASCTLISAGKANVSLCSSKSKSHSNCNSGPNDPDNRQQNSTAVPQQKRKTSQPGLKTKTKRTSAGPSRPSDTPNTPATSNSCLPVEVHVHSRGGFKIYRCVECGKRFTQKNRLISHQWVHTGQRPFSCQICGKMFSRQDNCQRHERLHVL